MIQNERANLDYSILLVLIFHTKVEKILSNLLNDPIF